jgi:hypothetical protein
MEANWWEEQWDGEDVYHLLVEFCTNRLAWGYEGEGPVRDQFPDGEGEGMEPIPRKLVMKALASRDFFGTDLYGMLRAYADRTRVSPLYDSPAFSGVVKDWALMLTLMPPLIALRWLAYFGLHRGGPMMSTKVLQASAITILGKWVAPGPGASENGETVGGPFNYPYGLDYNIVAKYTAPAFHTFLGPTVYALWSMAPEFIPRKGEEAMGYDEWRSPDTPASYPEIPHFVWGSTMGSALHTRGVTAKDDQKDQRFHRILEFFVLGNRVSALLKAVCPPAVLRDVMGAIDYVVHMAHMDPGAYPMADNFAARLLVAMFGEAVVCPDTPAPYGGPETTGFLAVPKEKPPPPKTPSKKRKAKKSVQKEDEGDLTDSDREVHPRRAKSSRNEEPEEIAILSSTSEGEGAEDGDPGEEGFEPGEEDLDFDALEVEEEAVEEDAVEEEAADQAEEEEVEGEEVVEENGEGAPAPEVG